MNNCVSPAARADRTSAAQSPSRPWNETAGSHEMRNAPAVSSSKPSVSSRAAGARCSASSSRVSATAGGGATLWPLSTAVR